MLIKGHQVLIREAVTNLIDNAIKHSPGGGTVSVGVRQCDSEKAAQISVFDTGPVFSQEYFLRLSQPFATGGTQSAGSGLGLSIAKDVTKAHEGQLTIANLPDKNGKQIIITLPLATPDQGASR